MNANQSMPGDMPRLEYWLSRPFWIFDDAIKLAYGVLDTDALLPPFDFMGTMDTLHPDKAEIAVVTAAMVEGVVKKAQRFGLTGRSTPNEWIEFFRDEGLPGYAVFRQAVEAAPEARRNQGAVQSVPKSEDGGAEYDAVRAVASDNGRRSGQARRDDRGYSLLRELWIKEGQGRGKKWFEKLARKAFDMPGRDETWKCFPTMIARSRGWIDEWQREKDQQERLKTDANG